jgi:hypothetical protein
MTKTPWLGKNHQASTRPVRTSNPTPTQVAKTVIAELEELGYMVSFYDGDDIDINQALLILSRAVLEEK